jgi:hypothetical protein
MFQRVVEIRIIATQNLKTLQEDLFGLVVPRGLLQELPSIIELHQEALGGKSGLKTADTGTGLISFGYSCQEGASRVSILVMQSTL